MKGILPGNVSSPEFVELKGDASDRKFVRMSFDEDGRRKTYILMIYPGEFSSSSLNFIEVQKFLKKKGLPVPEISRIIEEKGIVVLEDLGDVTMEMKLTAEPSAKKKLYSEAVDIIIKMQTKAKLGKNERCVAFTLQFDVEKFMYELNFFRHNYIEKFCGREISGADSKVLNDSFIRLSTELAAYPEKVFCHRDYHSRNLMVTSAGLFMVDFQDARIGLPQYDLASLLRDSYMELDKEFVESMTNYYVERREKSGWPVNDLKSFIYYFHLASIQRNIKAIGTFAFQKVEKGNDRYVKYIPTTFSYVRQNPVINSQMSEIGEIFDKYSLW
ncbi:MAG: phosphotransferase [Candidatus Schekmanbacteria bacterium]|nr:phosphotransferase [Candidatus Schekmanbacteria bacterium]